MPRLFAGLELPRDVRESLGRLKSPLPGARWLDPENYHVTLRFAGDIDNVVAQEFAGALAEIRLDSFTATISGLGTFGGRSPALIWAGLDGGPLLDELQRATELAARKAGLSPEPRNFKAHVTLARLKNTRPQEVARLLQRHARFATEPFFVGRFVLFSSRPRTGGGPYVVEDAYALRGGSLDNFAGLHEVW